MKNYIIETTIFDMSMGEDHPRQVKQRRTVYDTQMPYSSAVEIMEQTIDSIKVDQAIQGHIEDRNDDLAKAQYYHNRYGDAL